ncbi:MAG: hypothetical protein U0637_07415 [Phycisphaerales bacterium]
MLRPIVVLAFLAACMLAFLPACKKTPPADPYAAMRPRVLQYIHDHSPPAEVKQYIDAKYATAAATAEDTLTKAASATPKGYEIGFPIYYRAVTLDILILAKDDKRTDVLRFFQSLPDPSPGP